MRSNSIVITVFAFACNTPYLTNLPDQAVEPVIHDTPESNDSVQIPAIDVDDSTPENPSDDPAIDTDTNVPTDETLDSEPGIIEHPTMDENGNPLYPTIDPNFEDTGVAPDETTSRTLEDCNIPDDFMLVTYVDLDQDGYGAEPYSQSLNIGQGTLFFDIIDSGTPGHGIEYFSNSFQSNLQINSVNPGISNETVTSQTISRQAINLFPEIYGQNTGMDRFYSALEIINNEGGLSYELTPQMAMTTHRKQFRNELIFISEQRCASDIACFLTNYREFSNWSPSRFGFNKNVFLSYTLWGNGAGGYGGWYHGSPYSAAFWKGDDAIQYGYQYRSQNPYYEIYTFDRKMDLDPQANEGFFTCSWFGDDADGDGFTLADGDCNDGAAWISPSAREIPSNGVDNNCDGLEDCFMDLDGDGFPTITNIGQVVGSTCPLGNVRPSDCDDSNANINPNGLEIACNYLDENCDGRDM